MQYFVIMLIISSTGTLEFNEGKKDIENKGYEISFQGLEKAINDAFNNKDYELLYNITIYTSGNDLLDDHIDTIFKKYEALNQEEQGDRNMRQAIRSALSFNKRYIQSKWGYSEYIICVNKLYYPKKPSDICSAITYLSFYAKSLKIDLFPYYYKALFASEPNEMVINLFCSYACSSEFDPQEIVSKEMACNIIHRIERADSFSDSCREKIENIAKSDTDIVNKESASNAAILLEMDKIIEKDKIQLTEKYKDRQPYDRSNYPYFQE